MTAGRPRLVVMPKNNKSGVDPAPVKVQMESKLALGHKLGLGCLAVIFAVFILVMFVVIRNKTAPESSAAQRERRGYEAAFACQSAVRERLKSPGTASFQAPRDSRIKRYDSGNYEIVSYVDAQNSFGAKLRSSYTCVIAPAGAGFNVLELTIDGK
jgi:hypothetical protein